MRRSSAKKPGSRKELLECAQTCSMTTSLRMATGPHLSIGSRVIEQKEQIPYKKAVRRMRAQAEAVVTSYQRWLSWITN